MNKSGKLLREEQDVFPRHALEVNLLRSRSPVAGRFFNRYRNQSHTLKSKDYSARVDGVDLPFRVRAVGIHSFVSKQSH